MPGHRLLWYARRGLSDQPDRAKRMRQSRRYVPAANRDWLLPFYDPVKRCLLPEREMNERLVCRAELSPAHRVLDLGCGTATVTLLVKELHPSTRVVGVDPDPRALARARRKASAPESDVAFVRAFAGDLPFRDGCFDRVVSAFAFHHLVREEKRAALREVRRVLVPGGSLHLLDFGPPSGALTRVLAGLFHRGAAAEDNVRGELPRLIAGAGLVARQEVARRNTLFGTTSLYTAITSPT